MNRTKSLALIAAAAALAGCAAKPRGMVVQNVDEFVARDERMQVFNADATELKMIGQSSLVSAFPLVGQEKQVDTVRYYFANPRVEGLLEVSARKRKEGWEILDMEVDYTRYEVEPRDWHRNLLESQ